MSLSRIEWQIYRHQINLKPCLDKLPIWESSTHVVPAIDIAITGFDSPGTSDAPKRLAAPNGVGHSCSQLQDWLWAIWWIKSHESEGGRREDRKNKKNTFHFTIFFSLRRLGTCCQQGIDTQVCDIHDDFAHLSLWCSALHRLMYETVHQGNLQIPHSGYPYQMTASQIFDAWQWC